MESCDERYEKSSHARKLQDIIDRGKGPMVLGSEDEMDE